MLSSSNAASPAKDVSPSKDASPAQAVIPAKAGTQRFPDALDSRLRGNDGETRGSGGVDPRLRGDDEAARGGAALRFITCGSVDDGKSTLIGRLLVDSK